MRKKEKLARWKKGNHAIWAVVSMLFLAILLTIVVQGVSMYIMLQRNVTGTKRGLDSYVSTSSVQIYENLKQVNNKVSGKRQSSPGSSSATYFDISSNNFIEAYGTIESEADIVESGGKYVFYKGGSSRRPEDVLYSMEKPKVIAEDSDGERLQLKTTYIVHMPLIFMGRISTIVDVPITIHSNYSFGTNYVG